MRSPGSLSLALALALALAGGCGASRSALSADSAPPRPVVLVVHGRGYLRRDSTEFRRETLEALRQGAFAATSDSLFTSADLRLVWYADLLDARRRDASVTTCGGSARSAGTPTSSTSASSVLGIVAMLASALLDSDSSANQDVEVRGLAGDLRFFGDVTTRCAAEGRLSAALARARDEGRPVVLVAHSLGALVSWGHLQHRASSSDEHLPVVRRFVTVGSPLGNDGLREVLLGEGAGQLALPREVRSWVNVVNEEDPFASRLLGRVPTRDASTTKGISDVVSRRSSGDAHELRGYLRDSSTAGAVAAAWCEAFEGRAAVSGCARAIR